MLDNSQPEWQTLEHVLRATRKTAQKLPGIRVLDPRRNPFLILGLSSDASDSEIRKIAQRRLIQLRLSDAEDSDEFKAVQSASETLLDPVERFRWGLLWPDLTDSEAEAFRNDPVLSTAAGDGLQNGLATAFRAVTRNSSDLTRSFGAGCMLLIQAVEAIERAQDDTPDDLTDDLSCIRIWREVFDELQPIITSDRYRFHQRLRAKAFEDRRLTAEIADSMINHLPRQLLDPVGAVISKALLARHSTVAKAYVDLLNDSPFDAKTIEDLLSAVYKPLADRVEQHVNRLEAQVEDAGDGDEKKAIIVKVLDEFEQTVAPDLDVMLHVGDLPGYAEEHARDTAAELLRDISIEAWNQASDAKLANRSNQLARRYVDSTVLNQQLKEDREALRSANAGKELEPLQRAAISALESGDYVHAIRLLEDLLDKVDSSDADLGSLRSDVRRILTATYFNYANKNTRTLSAGLIKGILERAFELSDDPESLSLIMSAMTTPPMLFATSVSVDRGRALPGSEKRSPTRIPDPRTTTDGSPSDTKDGSDLIGCLGFIAIIVLFIIVGQCMSN